jgi:hypothetical protein
MEKKFNGRQGVEGKKRKFKRRQGDEGKQEDQSQVRRMEVTNFTT